MEGGGGKAREQLSFSNDKLDTLLYRFLETQREIDLNIAYFEMNVPIRWLAK
jgi:hypothetical protein